MALVMVQAAFESMLTMQTHSSWQIYPATLETKYALPKKKENGLSLHLSK